MREWVIKNSIMADSHKIPIRNKTTGEETLGEPNQSKQNSGVQSIHSKHTPNPDTPKPPLSTSGAKKKPSQEIKNLEQFLTYAYERKGQRIRLKPTTLKAISKQPKLNEDARKKLLGIAKTDVLLAVPLRLLLKARDIVDYPILRNEIRNFIREVLQAHAVFLAPELAGVLKNIPGAPDLRASLAIVAATDYSQVKGLDKDKSLKTKDYEELRTNVTYCLVTWFAETRSLALETITQYLFESLWLPESSSAKDETEKLSVLTEISDLDGVGLACQIFKQKADRQAHIAESAKKAQEAALIENQTLRETGNELRLELEQRNQKIADLTQAIEAQKQAHEHNCLHLQDDFEQLRTRLLRRLKSEVNLLDEGLHALRRDPPKIRVMVDHAERALDGLKKEIKELGLED